jgi:hypothetical protein
MNTTGVASAIAADVAAGIEPRWEVAGQFLDALARRDFAELQSCLDINVRFRALLPGGLLEANNATQATALFRRWFGQHVVFDMLDAAIGQAGPYFYLRWQIRTGSHGDPTSVRLVEQHTFAATRERIEALDLLSSVFTPATPTQ